MRRETELAAVIASAGWRLVRSKKHNVWRCPCGKHMFVNSHSIGNHSGMVNAISKFKTISRQCPSLPAQRRSE